jgi:predicted glycogen debranching enzyme
MSDTLHTPSSSRVSEAEHARACTVDPEAAVHGLASQEWLVTNGLGGYAAGTLNGAIARRFHGLLVSALPSPLGRTMMLNHLAEVVRLKDGRSVQLGAQTRLETPQVPIARCASFQLELGLPVWRLEYADVVIERRVLMPHGQNTVYVTYELLSGSESEVLELEPWVHFRHHAGPVEVAPCDDSYLLRVFHDRFEISIDGNTRLPPLRMQTRGSPNMFHIEGKRIHDLRYRIEMARGDDAIGSLYTPGYFRLELVAHERVAFVASTEDWQTISGLTHDELAALERKRRSRMLSAAAPAARVGPAAELIFAADQFLITPKGRSEDAAWARASGDEIRTIVAGYPWFTDWGRDTMISFEGLTLITGRHADAGRILRSFAHHARDGLIPNMFPEGEHQGLYHTADATLWFFHALDRYLTYTRDVGTLRLLLPTLEDIIEQHLRGTRFGIRVDPNDGLLAQGADGYQLTWMDAKVGDLVVTPRRGKTVEINALWYNALRLMARWVRDIRLDEPGSREFAEHAKRARRSFNHRFWIASSEHLYDVVDGDTGNDASFRPNQLFAISLPHSILDEARWEPVLMQVKERLLTPLGLRSLAPGHPEYSARYFGDLRAPDLAYHQGTVWVWLIGPFIDAWMRVFPERVKEARAFLAGVLDTLSEGCVGSLSEMYDAEPPYVSRGCFAQAWSVAEVLRSFVCTV